MTHRVPIQSLWIGPRLSAMEQLCIRSFLANGHPFRLYVYDEVAEIPAGTELCDANAILDRSRIFTYAGNGSVAGFANMFRYKLLLEGGGWWVDLDTICLRPFEFAGEYVFASEFTKDGETLCNGVLQAAAGSPFLHYVWQVCESKDPAKLVWGETGPRLVGEAVRELRLERFIQPAAAFCPLPFRDWRLSIDPAARFDFGAGTWAVHLWQEMWRRTGLDKDAAYHPDCPFERLKARYREP